MDSKKDNQKKSIRVSYDKMFVYYPDILCVKDVMSALKISRHRVYDIITSGELASFRIGKTHKIAKRALITYINQAK